MQKTTQDPHAFIALSEYETPDLPADAGLRKLWKRLADRFEPDDEPYMAGDKLKQTTSSVLEEAASLPDWGPLVGDLKATLSDCLNADNEGTRIRLIVLPPCDHSGLVRAWADTEGLQCLEPPVYEQMLSNETWTVPDALGPSFDARSEPLVVPRLEGWFLRHRGGLAVIRQLLDAMDRSERRIIIGCNAWAWSYLSRAVEADSVLPDPLTHEPFGPDRLAVWFSELAQRDGGRPFTMRSTTSGNDVLARSEDGSSTSDVLRTLAATSRGIPWVAWALWRRMLRGSREEATRDEKALNDEELDALDDDTVLWVTEVETLSLPGRHIGEALMLLHALLLHGTLTREQLRFVLPHRGDVNVLSALVRSGFVDRLDDGQLSIAAAAYPSIRDEMEAAGMPLAAL